MQEDNRTNKKDNRNDHLKNRVQTILTPYCKDAVRYERQITGITESQIVAKIVSDYFRNINNIRPGFDEWRRSNSLIDC